VPRKNVTPETARKFVAAVDIPEARKTRGAAVVDKMAVLFDAAKAQAAVVGGDVISFVPGVTSDRKEAILNSSLLAQLAASKKIADRARVYEWYEAYFEVLQNIGWVVQDKGFSEYEESSGNFEAHKAILAVATVVLGAAPTALAIIKSTIEALHSMDESRPWITIFNRESQKAKTARFQIGLAEQDANGQFFVNVLAFGLEASSNVTQVLFFKAKKQDAKLKHYSGRVTINEGVLNAVGPAIKQKLVGHASTFIAQLPDL